MIISYMFLILIFITQGVNAGTLSIDAFFSQDDKKRVLGNEIISRSCFDLAPGRCGGMIVVPKTKFSGADLSGYELIVTEKAYVPFIINENGILEMYNSLTAYSKLSGTAYYSVTEKKLKTFIIKSYRIKSPEETDPVGDIKSAAVPGAAVNYLKLEDNRFGDIVFKSEVFSEGDDFIVVNASVHALKKYGLTLCGPGEYRIIFYFMYDKNARGYFYYAAHAIKIRASYLGKLGVVSAESFANRLRAMTVRYADLLGQDWNWRLNVPATRK